MPALGVRNTEYIFDGKVNRIFNHCGMWNMDRHFADTNKNVKKENVLAG
jgi:hypothetical protein